MKRLLVISATIAGLTLLPLLHAQERQTKGKADPALVLPQDVDKPVPRLPDGHPDLSGPWDGCWKSGKDTGNWLSATIRTSPNLGTLHSSACCSPIAAGS